MRLIFATLLLMSSTTSLAASLASSVGLFVYPANNQTSEQQEQDDYQCYAWAKDETGFDPINSKPPEEVQAQAGAKPGSGTRGALRGAARGALLGEVIDDDAGDGAAIGATVGMMRGRSQSRRQAQSEADAANAQNQSNYASQQGNFKKAMSLCLQARGYSAS